jgi:hypothetical protein
MKDATLEDYGDNGLIVINATDKSTEVRVRWYGGGQAPALPVHIRQRARNLARVSALVF